MVQLFENSGFRVKTPFFGGSHHYENDAYRVARNGENLSSGVAAG